MLIKESQVVVDIEGMFVNPGNLSSKDDASALSLDSQKNFILVPETVDVDDRKSQSHSTPQGKTVMRKKLDIDKQINSTRKILWRNNAIWNRCKKSLGKASSLVSTNNNPFSSFSFKCPEKQTKVTLGQSGDKNQGGANKDAPGSMMFTKTTYRNVKASSITHGEFRFTTTPTYDEKLFCVKALCELPKELNPDCMFRVPYLIDETGCTTKFVDYERYFENCLNLKNSIFMPLLGKLRTHLDVIRSSLLEIDQWLKTGESKLYLETKFSTTLKSSPNKNDSDSLILLKSLPSSSGWINLIFDILEEKSPKRRQLEKLLEFADEMARHPH